MRSELFWFSCIVALLHCCIVAFRQQLSCCHVGNFSRLSQVHSFCESIWRKWNIRNIGKMVSYFCIEWNLQIYRLIGILPFRILCEFMEWSTVAHSDKVKRIESESKECNASWIMQPNDRAFFFIFLSLRCCSGCCCLQISFTFCNDTCYGIYTQVHPVSFPPALSHCTETKWNVKLVTSFDCFHIRLIVWPCNFTWNVF